MKKKKLNSLTLNKKAVANLKGGKDQDADARSLIFHCTILNCPTMQYSCPDPYCTIA